MVKIKPNSARGSSANKTTNKQYQRTVCASTAVSVGRLLSLFVEMALCSTDTSNPNRRSRHVASEFFFSVKKRMGYREDCRSLTSGLFLESSLKSKAFLLRGVCAGVNSVTGCDFSELSLL